MTAYYRDYGIPLHKPATGKHIPYGRQLSEMDKELLKWVAERKRERAKEIAKAQALERKAARIKMQRERTAARSHEYEPA